MLKREREQHSGWRPKNRARRRESAGIRRRSQRHRPREPRRHSRWGFVKHLNVTQSAAPIPFYNFLTAPAAQHTPQQHLIYYLGFVFRWAFLFPIRLQILLFASAWIFTTAVVSHFIRYSQRQRLYVCMVYARTFGAAMGMVSEFHNPENRPKAPGIAVANHMTANDIQYIFADVEWEAPVDPVGYTVTGQKHSGFIGFIIRGAARIAPTFFLDRTNPAERRDFHRNIIEVAKNGQIDPVLLFPEGYCANNTAILQFRRAAFEADIDVYPIAVRQNPIVGDSFWREDTFPEYLLRIMSSWCIRYDVYYLPKVRRRHDEDNAEFARRVQHLIAEALGVEALDVDGQRIKKVAAALKKRPLPKLEGKPVAAAF